MFNDPCKYHLEDKSNRGRSFGEAVSNASMLVQSSSPNATTTVQPFQLTMQTTGLQCQSLCWALLLLVGVNFLFGVVFMQLSMDFLEALDAFVKCFCWSRATSAGETFQ